MIDTDVVPKSIIQQDKSQQGFVDGNSSKYDKAMLPEKVLTFVCKPSC